MNIITFIPLISAIVVFVLGFLVWRKGQRDRLSYTFALFSFFTAIWMIGTFMMFLNKGNLEAVAFWDRFVYVGVVYIPVAMFHFGLALTKNNTLKGKILLISGYILATLFLFLIPTKFFVNDIFIYKWGVHTKAQVFHHLFLAFFAFYVIAWFIMVYGYYNSRKISLVEKERVKYCFIAFIALASFGSLGFLPAYGVSIYPFSYLSGLIFVIIISYTIIRHRLMDVKLVLRKSTVVLASFVVVFGFAALVKILAEKIFLIFDFWVDLLVLAVGIFTYPYVRDYFFKLANKHFFSSLYDSRKVILETTNKIRTFLDTKKIYEFLDKTFVDIFHTRKFGVLDLDEEDNCYVVNYNNGFNLGNRKKFAENSALHNMFIKKNKTIILEEAKDLHYNEKTKETIDLMDKMGVELLVPLNIKKRTVGLLVLGPKETKEMYNDEDLQVLEIIGGQAAVSIENAQLYGEVKNFNRRLKKEIKEATTDLEKTNKELRTANIRLSKAYKKLRQLDDAKNEFVSIASHQLRTPLTSIKGFISMILQGDFGKYSSSVEDALKKIYISNERLIKLVNDLLSISRIEAGRFVFNLNKNNIKELISKTVETFEMEAKNKNLDLKLDLPEKDPEPFVFDKEKIQEVISNLIDNAIKYTQEGEIEIKLEDLKNKARITVSDSGRGMLKSEIESVFEKFRRGKKSNNLNTEGTGLGLYVCEKIVSAHQGKIWAESDGMGKGSRFIVEIPKNLEVTEKEASRKKKKR
ncbi:MAG: ATP-binding protein [Patescibacteria group bacterium]